MTINRAIAVGAVFLVAAAGLWLSASTTGPAMEPAAHPKAIGAPQPSDRRSSPGRLRIRKPAAASSALTPQASAADPVEETPTRSSDRRALPPQSALQHYLRSSRFPPTSRPLTLDNGDLIHPNRRHERRRRTEDDPEVSFLFTADRFFVNGNEPLTAILQAWRGSAPVVPEVVAASMRVVEPNLGPGAPVAFGVADGIASATIVPAQLIEAEHAVVMAFEVTFTVDDVTQTSSFNFQFTPPNSVPARFVDRMQASVVDGSLVVSAGIEVIRPGYYIIDANLWAAEEPVAWTRFKGQLTMGQTTVALRFFGKAIRDRDISGPYRLGEVRGARFEEGREPDMDHIPTIAFTGSTPAYDVTTFSDAEWTSPAKQRKIEALERATLDPNAQPGSAAAPPSDAKPELPVND